MLLILLKELSLMQLKKLMKESKVLKIQSVKKPNKLETKPNKSIMKLKEKLEISKIVLPQRLKTYQTELKVDTKMPKTKLLMLQILLLIKLKMLKMQ